MVHKDEVGGQLKRLGVSFQFWCRPEIRELPKILFEGEQLQHVLIGRYEGGFALFTATDRRVLLIDKKPFYLTLEDIRYDMISDVQYNHRLIDATVRLGTVHKTVSFTGYNHNKLRNFTAYIQQQVMFYRQQQDVARQPVPQPTFLPLNPQTQPEPSPIANAALNVPRKPVMNPYNMPVMIRRRISRFY
jgi:hypothetical protein